MAEKYKGKKLVLVDGHSQAYRSFYALPGFRNSKGQPTNAVLGFTNALLRHLRDLKPDFLAVSFDLPKPTFRTKLLEQYKVHRPPMPDDLRSQMPLVRKVVDALGVPVFEKEGFEADDCLATLTDQARKQGMEVYILTADKDILQLVDDHVHVIREHKDGPVVYGDQEVKERYGVLPKEMLDFIALMGDASDNIPGVPGIGEKTAALLIGQFGSLDNLFLHPEKIKTDKLREKVVNNVEIAKLSRQVARLVHDVPLDIDWSRCDAGLIDLKKPVVIELFKELEFRKLLMDIDRGTEGQGEQKQGQGTSMERKGQGKAKAKEKEEKETGGQGDGEITLFSKPAEFETIEGLEDLKVYVKGLRRMKELCMAVAGGEGHPLTAPVLGIAFACSEGKSCWVPLPEKGRDKTVQALQEVLEDGDVMKCGHDLKTMVLRLSSLGIEPAGLDHDVMVSGHLVDDEGGSARDVMTLLMRHTGEMLSETEDPVQAAVLAAQASRKLRPVLEEKLRTLGMEKLFRGMEMPLLSVLAGMERRGVAVDIRLMAGLSRELDAELKTLTRDITAAAGETFNINSTQQLGKILFEKLNLPVVRKTKTGYSTDVEVLETLQDQHPLPGFLLKYRQLTKLKGTYVDAIPALMLPSTGRVHTVFHQTATATGRLSSSDPNMQNIPVRTGWGERIREAFVPGGNGQVLLSADYSQVELRVLAHLSGDRSLLSAFRSGEDIHAQTARNIFGTDAVTPEQRRQAKVVNFGILYGMSPYGLAKELEIDHAKAMEYIDHYFRTYPGVRNYLDAVISGARQSVYVSTLSGRRRNLPDINHPNRNKREMAERMAVNTPVQGTAAELMKQAMLDVDAALRSKRWPLAMILQVHDEMVFEVPKGEAEALAEQVRRLMEKAMVLDVPVKVDVKWGRNWREAHP